MLSGIHLCLVVLTSLLAGVTQASVNDDILTQFHTSDYALIEIDGKQTPVFTFPSNLANTRATIVFVLDARNSRLNSAMHQLANTLPNVGVSTVMFLDESSIGVELTSDIESANENEQSPVAETVPEQTSEQEGNTQSSGNENTSEEVSYAATAHANAQQTDTTVDSLAACTKTLDTRIKQLFSNLGLSPSRTAILSAGNVSGCLFSIDKIPADALITINPFIDHVDLNKQLSKNIASTSQPVLDLVNNASDPRSIHAASQRRVSSTRALKAHYRQREIIGHGIGPLQVDYMAKEIYGWLTYLGY